MKYSVLSSLEYDNGKFMLLCSRFSNMNTYTALPSEFLRRCLEWLTTSSESELIRVVVVVNKTDDGSVGVIDSTSNINVTRAELKDLSDTTFLSGFDCLIFHGLDNNLSPLIRANIENYVSTGGGALFSDINVDTANIDLFSGISSVYSLGSGVNLGSGDYVWTAEGIVHHVYSPDFSDLTIPVINTIAETGLGAGWVMLYVYDTSLIPEVVESPSVTDTIYSSSDYDIPGANMMAYFASVYENGVFQVEN